MPAATDPPILIRRRLDLSPTSTHTTLTLPLYAHSESPYECLARVTSSSASTAGQQEPYAEGEQYYSQPVNEPFGDTLPRGRACQAKPHETEAVGLPWGGPRVNNKPKNHAFAAKITEERKEAAKCSNT